MEKQMSKKNGKQDMVPQTTDAAPATQNEPIINLPEKFSLTHTETLEVKNFDLRRELLKSEQEKIMLQEQIWMLQVSQRVKVNISNYVVDPVNGVCTIRPDVKTQLQNQMKAGSAAATEPKVN